MLEFAVRKQISEHGNIEILENCRATEFIALPGGTAVGGVRFQNSHGQAQKLGADLVIDASGHGSLTLAFLESMGIPVPAELSIGVDIGYATALLDIPKDASQEWMGIYTHPQYPQISRAALLLPVEGNRWIVTVAGRYEDKPPGKWDGCLDFAQRLRTRTVYNAVCHAKAPAEVVQFGFKASRWRPFGRAQDFPSGLIPLGDAICRFNPIYGQGMSVAILEAETLHKLLAQQSAAVDGVTNFSTNFFSETDKLIDTAWSAAAVPDFLHPRTEGVRPPNLETTLKFSAALLSIAADDPAVHKLLLEVQGLLKLRSAYQNPELAERVKAAMAA